jgi:type II secretory pathway component PulC
MKSPLMERIVRILASASVLFTLVFVLWVVVKAVFLPEIPGPATANPSAFEWPIVHVPSDEEWSVIQHSGTALPGNQGPLSQTLRLAGTFFVYAEATGNNVAGICKAIIDDIQKKEQYLVQEGETFGNVDVIRIFQDHVVLRSQGQEEELWLSFSSGSSTSKASAPTTGVAAVSASSETVLETNRFGRKVGDARWVFSRQALLEYYQELMDDPDRLASLFVSMKPDYKEGAITGYALDPIGEKEFYSAIGLNNGDVVRKVNSMKMTSQARAEYFISEFLKNRLSAVVIDIERNGQPQKMIYMIR